MNTNGDYQYNGNNENSENNGNYESNGYNPNDYAFRTVMRNGRPKTLGWSVASMVCGIVGVVCCCFGWSALFLGAIAIALAIVSRVKLGYFDGMSIAGLILGIFAFVFGLAIVAVIFANPEMIEQYLEEYMKQIEEMEQGFGGGTNNGF